MRKPNSKNTKNQENPAEEYQEVDNPIPQNGHNESSSEEWQDDQDEDQEMEGIIIEDGMEYDFDAMQDEQEDDPENSDMDTINLSMKTVEKPVCIASTFSEHKEEIVCLCVNPVNHKEFVSGGMDDQFIIWNVDSETKTHAQKFKETISFVDYGFDGQLIAAACLDDNIFVFEKNMEGNPVEKYQLASTSDEVTVN